MCVCIYVCVCACVCACVRVCPQVADLILLGVLVGEFTLKIVVCPSIRRFFTNAVNAVYGLSLLAAIAGHVAESILEKPVGRITRIILTSFYNRIVPMGFLPREIRVAFPGESRLGQSRATQPTVHAGCFIILHNPSDSDMDYGIFNVHTDVNACDCTWDCTDTHKRVCSESCLLEENPFPHWEVEPALAACQSDALPTELHPHHLWYLACQ